MRLAFLHGFTGAPDVFDAVGVPGAAEALLGHAPRLVRPGTFSGEVERLAARLAPLAPLHLVGYSLGARLALALLARAPALFARATLVGVHPGLRDGTTRVAEDEAWARLLETAGIEAFVARWEAQPLFASQARLPAEVRARHRERRLSHSPAGLAAALRALGLGVMPDLWPALRSLPMPVTFIAGELDEKFVELARRAAALAPRGALRVVPGVGHDVVLERPTALLETAT